MGKKFIERINARIALISIAAILVVGLLFFLWPAGKWHFYVIVDNLNGAAEGAPVFFNNKRVGTISEIANIGSKIRLDLTINRRIKIPRNSIITIKREFLKPYKAFVQIESIYLKEGIVKARRFIKPGELIIGSPAVAPTQLLTEFSPEIPGYWSSLKTKPKFSNAEKAEYQPLSPTELLANAIMKNNELMARTAREFRDAARSIKENTMRFGVGLNRLIDNMNNAVEEQRRSLYTATNNFAAISHNLRKTVDEIYKFSKIKPKIEVQVAATPPKAKEEPKPKILRGEKEWKAPSMKELLTRVKPHIEYGLEYNQGYGGVSNDVNLRLAKSYTGSYLEAGIKRRPDGYKYNVQYAKRISDWSQRVGLIESEVGIGLDYNFNDNSKVSLDIIGLTAEPKVNVYGQYKLKNDYKVKFGIDNFYKDSQLLFGVTKQY